MVKFEIAHRMHQAAGISEEEAGRLLDWILELFKSTLQKGEPISVPNFGVFTLRNKVARNGTNPKTGQPLIIPSRRVVIFHPSPRLKADVSGVQAEPPAVAGTE
jgi:integration host factor subunit alpha